MDESNTLLEKLPSIITGLSTEVKIMPLFGLDENPRNRCQVRDGLLERLDRNTEGIEMPALASIGHACRTPLFKAGAVEISQEGYKLTSLGKDVILPIAALMLNYSATSGQSLYNLFGEDSTKTGQSAPFGRFKTLLTIAEKGQTSKRKLAEETGLNEDTINRYTDAFRINGLISVESIGDNQERAEVRRYKVIKTKSVVPTHPKSRKVLQVLEKFGDLSPTKINAELSKRRVKISAKELRDRLVSLIKSGHIELTPDSWSQTQVYSKVNPLEGAYNFAEKLAKPLKRALSEPEYLAEIRSSYLAPLENPDYLRSQLSQALSNYRSSTNRIGPTAEDTRQTQRARELLSALTGGGEIISRKELAERLGVSRTTLKLSVDELQSSGVVTVISNSTTGKRLVALRP